MTGLCYVGNVTSVLKRTRSDLLPHAPPPTQWSQMTPRVCFLSLIKTCYLIAVVMCELLLCAWAACCAHSTDLCTLLSAFCFLLLGCMLCMFLPFVRGCFVHRLLLGTILSSIGSPNGNVSSSSSTSTTIDKTDDPNGLACELLLCLAQLYIDTGKVSQRLLFCERTY